MHINPAAAHCVSSVHFAWSYDDASKVHDESQTAKHSHSGRENLANVFIAIPHAKTASTSQSIVEEKRPAVNERRQFLHSS